MKFFALYPRHGTELTSIAQNETPLPSMMFACQRQQAWAGINAGIEGMLAGNVGSQHALSSSNIQNLLARLNIEQIQHGWNRQFAVMEAATFAHPTIVPIRHRFPTGNEFSCAMSHLFHRHYLFLSFTVTVKDASALSEESISYETCDEKGSRHPQTALQ
jgi:hypothetical protein